VRVERVRIQHFGSIDRLDSGRDALGSLVVVTGPNESGKTTFFNFLTTALYGFQPASADKHPYSPWTGESIDGQLTLKLDTGTRVEVHRKLRSSPWGRLRSDQGEEDIRNRPLPFLDHVPRSVFTQVFALTLQELSRLEGATWSTIQDRMIASMVSDDVRSAREVAEELRSEAGSLWRPNRRGRQAVRELAEQIRELQSARRDAAELDRQLRDRDRELAGARVRLDALKAERELATRTGSRFERLLPGKRKLKLIQDLESRLLPDLDDSAFPPDATTELERLTEQTDELAERIERIDARLDETRRRVRGFGSSERAVLDAEDRLRSAIEGVEGARAAGATLQGLEDDVRTLEHKARDQARELFRVPFEQLDRERLRTVPISEVDSAVKRLYAVREELRLRKEAGASLPGDDHPPARDWIVAIVACSLGTLFMAYGVMSSWTPGWALGGGLLGIGVTTLVRWLRRRRASLASEHARQHAQAALHRLTRSEAEAAARLRELLHDLPMHASQRESPPLGLGGRFEHVARLLEELHHKSARLPALRTTVAEAERAATKLAEELGVSVEGDHPASALGRSLTMASAARDDAARARRDLGALEKERLAVEERRDRAAATLSALRKRLSTLGEGDVENGVERLRRHREARVRLDRAIQELAQTFGDEGALHEEIEDLESEAGPLTEEALAVLRGRMRDLNEQIEDLRGDVTARERDLAHLRQGPSVAEIDGEIEALQQERERLAMERDRRVFLARLLEEADRRFRARHQPDVIRRSAEYVEAITDGRYQRLAMGSNGSSGKLFVQRGAGRKLDVTGPLSTGTREQIYLALRLAVVDHLDEGSERLPLFLDESFVNWDAQRRDRTFRLLRRISDRRQVFVFTCHRGMADRLEAMGARVVRLGMEEQVELW
jgi:uncharacterized protein YhaN